MRQSINAPLVEMLRSRTGVLSWLKWMKPDQISGWRGSVRRWASSDLGSSPSDCASAEHSTTMSGKLRASTAFKRSLRSDGEQSMRVS